MKAKSNSKARSKSPVNNNPKPDEMKKNPILPPKKGTSKSPNPQKTNENKEQKKPEVPPTQQTSITQEQAALEKKKK